MATVNLGKVRFNWVGNFASIASFKALDVGFSGSTVYVCKADKTYASAGQFDADAASFDVLGSSALAAAPVNSVVVRTSNGISGVQYGESGLVLTSTGKNTAPVWKPRSGRPNSTPYVGTSAVTDGTTVWYPGEQFGRYFSHVAFDIKPDNGACHGARPFFFITPDRKNVKVSGYNAGGVLGVNHYDDQISTSTYPGTRYSVTFQYCQFDTALDADEFFAYVTANYYDSCVVTTKGNLYWAGFNTSSQWGEGNSTRSTVFRRMTFFGPATGRRATSVYFTTAHSMVTTNPSMTVFVRTLDGRLFGCGANTAGILGQNDTTARSTFVQIGNTQWGTTAKVVGFSWRNIYTGNDNTWIAWLDNGQIWGCGYPLSNTFGRNNTTQLNVPTRLTELETVIETAVPGDRVRQIFKPWGHNTAQVNCVTYVLTNAGRLYSCGRGQSGDLGLGGSTGAQNQPVFLEVICPDNRTWASVHFSNGACWVSAFGITTDGYLYAWGDNRNQQLGFFNDGSNRSTPIEVTGLPSGFQGNMRYVWSFANFYQDTDNNGNGQAQTFFKAFDPTTGQDRYASAGYWGGGVLCQAGIDRRVDQQWGGNLPAREITSYLPNFGQGLVDILYRHNTSSTNSFMTVQWVYRDGRSFISGYQNNQSDYGLSTGFSLPQYQHYPMEMRYM
jgi:alpha-tubulin suppressor-like RCC1 family protein